MVNIIFATAVYLMHNLVIKPVNFIGRFHYLLEVLCVYKRPCFGQFQKSIHILDYPLNLLYFGLKLIK